MLASNLQVLDYAAGIEGCRMGRRDGVSAVPDTFSTELFGCLAKRFFSHAIY
jgi:hypothetical protein